MSVTTTGTQPTQTEGLTLRENASVEALETIPLPVERVRAGEPFTVVTDDVTAWPGQRLTWRFEYNDYMNRWVFECEHPSMGYLFTRRNVATLGRTYSAYPFMMARFVAPATMHPPSAITAGSLADRVTLTVAPGPAGGSFLDAAGLSRDEQDALLGRYASDHPITEEWV